jgi:hypothetical protein
MKRLVGLTALAGAALLGCSSCPAPTSTASAIGDFFTLDAATPQASRELFVHAPPQDCGCTWCGDPTLALELTGKVGWSNPSETSAYPVVRFTLVAHPPSADDTLDPPLPVDVVLTPTSPSSELVIRATHLCPEGDVCEPSFTLTAARVEPALEGSVDVAWAINAAFPSKPDGSLRVTLAP